MVLGLLLALVACILYGVATLIQAVGSKKAEGLDAFLQPLVIIGLVISVLGAPRVLPVSLRPVDMVGAGIVLVGLVVVAGAAGAEHPEKPGGRFVTILLVISAALAVGTVLSYRKAPAWLMAVWSGLGFSLVAIGARAAETDGTLWGMIWNPIAIVVLVGGAVGVVGNIRALAKGSVAIAAATVSVLEVIIPSVVGVTVLGDTVRAGWAIPLVLAVLVALAGCAILAASPAGKATADS